MDNKFQKQQQQAISLKGGKWRSIEKLLDCLCVLHMIKKNWIVDSKWKPATFEFWKKHIGLYFIYKPSLQNDLNQKSLSYISSCVRKSTEAASNYCWDLHSNEFPASCVVACPNHCIP